MFGIIIIIVIIILVIVWIVRRDKENFAFMTDNGPSV